jgi:hypothetical protein
MKSFLRQIEENFESLNEKDWDGDGKQETPEQEYMGVKDRAIKKAMNDNPECDSCYGSGCDDCKNTGMKPEYQDVEQCTKCKGEGCLHCSHKGYHIKESIFGSTLGANIASTRTNRSSSNMYNPNQQHHQSKSEKEKDFSLHDLSMHMYGKEYWQLENDKVKDIVLKLYGQIMDPSTPFSIDDVEPQIDEMSTSAGAGGYMTPNAFKPADDDTVEVLGYKRVQEAMDRRYEQLIEGYRDFALGNSKLTPEQKVKESIKNVARQLKEIETTVSHTARLKTESGISHSGFKPATLKALSQISERLIKISERVRSLGE